MGGIFEGGEFLLGLRVGFLEGRFENLGGGRRVGVLLLSAVVSGPGPGPRRLCPCAGPKAKRAAARRGFGVWGFGVPDFVNPKP